MEAEALASIKKKAKNEGRTIVFIDESGLGRSARTAAVPGRHADRRRYCNITSTGKPCRRLLGWCWWRSYFRLFPGAIRSPQIIEFLTHLLRHIPGKLLIIWDGLPGHRSRAVWEFVQQQRGRLWLEYLAGYAPELNPVEYLWSHWKQHELPRRILSARLSGN